jgi:hypothetical protein
MLIRSVKIAMSDSTEIASGRGRPRDVCPEKRPQYSMPGLIGFETTLSGRSYVKLLTDMKASGYRGVLFFLWLPNAEMAVARVENRVQQGGHGVPPEDVRRRYAAGVLNLFRLCRPTLHGWWLYDASRLPPRLIAVEGDGQLVVKQKRLYRRIEQQTEESHEESHWGSSHEAGGCRFSTGRPKGLQTREGIRYAGYYLGKWRS